MKRIYLVGLAATVMLFGSCGSGEVDMTEILTDNADANDIHDAAAGFAEGLSTTGQGYFSGLLAEVIEVDVKFKEVEAMDDMDATAEEINKTLDATLEKIDEGRAAMDLYKDKTWPLRAEFHTLTEEWFNTVESIVNDHLYGLADQMALPDEDWTDEHWAAYDEYSVAYEAYADVDNRWVEFQYDYADANGFEIGGFIDEESMVEEAISEDAH